MLVPCTLAVNVKVMFASFIVPVMSFSPRVAEE